MKTTSWMKLLEKIAEGDKIIACTLTEEELLVPFDSGVGAHEGKPFTAWSAKYVYFSVDCDDEEWVDRVPRNPLPGGTGAAIKKDDFDIVSTLGNETRDYTSLSAWEADTDNTKTSAAVECYVEDAAT